jgi:hypothetical protein
MVVSRDEWDITSRKEPERASVGLEPSSESKESTCARSGNCSQAAWKVLNI